MKSKKFKSFNLEEMLKVYPKYSNGRKKSLIQPNQRFNHLVTIYESYELTKGRKPNQFYKTCGWVCKCDCGNYTFYKPDKLLSGEAITCGHKCPLKGRNTHNLTGQTFDRLTVIERVGKSKDGHAAWKCKCSCGNETIVEGRYLEHHKIHSCGSCPDNLKSMGNNYINNWLIEHNINFKAEVRFDGCRDKYPLIFDFVIMNNQGKVLKCIEYQGNQHYISTGGWSTEESVEAVQKRDKIKKDYCREMGIELLCIPYTEYKNLDNILKKFV